MEFDNAFDVPLPVNEAWKVLMDIRRVAPCMPGAELTEVVDERTYKGKINVRLGPVALSFAGTVKFQEIDDANHRARIAAQGSDAKGRGAANAVAEFGLEPAGGGSKVLVHTNLTLSGAVAQYGRGVGIIQVTAGQIITAFANNLKAQLAERPETERGVAAAVAPPPSRSPAAHERGTSAPPAQPPAAVAEQLAAGPTAARPSDSELPPANPPAAKPISGFTLAASVLWQSLKRLFGRD